MLRKVVLWESAALTNVGDDTGGTRREQALALLAAFLLSGRRGERSAACLPEGETSGRQRTQLLTQTQPLGQGKASGALLKLGRQRPDSQKWEQVRATRLPIQARGQLRGGKIKAEALDRRRGLLGRLGEGGTCKSATKGKGTRSRRWSFSNCWAQWVQQRRIKRALWHFKD